MIDQKINEAVARKLGWSCHEHPILEKNDIVMAHGWVRPNPLKACFHEAVPDYCHSIEAAWEIVEFVRHMQTDSQMKAALKCRLALHSDGQWNMWFPGMSIGEEADTAPMAICLAFLKLDVQVAS